MSGYTLRQLEHMFYALLKLGDYGLPMNGALPYGVCTLLLTTSFWSLSSNEYWRSPRQLGRAKRQHPQTLRHAAVATTKDHSKSDWEKDALMRAGIIATLLDRHVELWGIDSDLASLWAEIRSKRCSNPHLAELLCVARDRLHVHQEPRDYLQHLHAQLPPWEEGCAVRLRPPEVAVQAWELHWDLAQRVSVFLEGMPAYYPRTTELNWHHGQMRGGNMCFCLSGVAPSHALTMAFCLFLFCSRIHFLLRGGCLWGVFPWGPGPLSFSLLRSLAFACRHCSCFSCAWVAS